MDIKVVTVIGIPEPEMAAPIVAWIVKISGYGTDATKTYRLTPGQMSTLQDALGVDAPIDCEGKSFKTSLSCDDLKVCFESVVGPVGVVQAVTA